MATTTKKTAAKAKKRPALLFSTPEVNKMAAAIRAVDPKLADKAVPVLKTAIGTVSNNKTP